MANNPALDPQVENPEGVPISAIIFGGRRATTAAAAGTIGQVRRDPMAMLPFCGYNMGDYFRHWIAMRKLITLLPRIFHVNWFRKDEVENFLWPGYGENMRVLKWIVDRCHGRADANETPLGWVPGAHSFDLGGMEGYTPDKPAQAQNISLEDWRRELLSQDELFMKLYSHLP